MAVGAEDPTSTSLVSKVELKLERSDWKVGANGRVAITADADAFYLEIGLATFEDEQVIFERTWKEHIERIYA